MDNTQTNIEVADAALVAIQNGDIEGALGRFEDDARWGVAQSLAQGGLHTGKDAIRALLGAVRERYPGGYKLLNLTTYATDEHAFAETTRAIGSDTQAAGSEHVLFVFHIVMGKIREVREFVYSAH